MKRILAALALLVSPIAAQAQTTFSNEPPVQLPLSGSDLALVSQVVRNQYVTGKTTLGAIATYVQGTLSGGGGGSGTVASGTLGQIAGYGSSGTAVSGVTPTGDATISGSTGAVVVTKTNGTAFSALATTTPGAGVATALGNATNAASGIPSINGAMTVGDCVKWSASGIQDAGAACGSGGGGLNINSLYNYGPGTDGALTFDGTTTVLGMVPVAGVYTLVRPIFATTLTINGTGKLVAMARIFCSVQLDLSNAPAGAIQWNGNNGNPGATSGTAGSATGVTVQANDTNYYNSPGPFNGPGSGSVASGASPSNSVAGGRIVTGYGGTGGAGGNGTSGTGGSAGGFSSLYAVTPPVWLDHAPIGIGSQSGPGGGGAGDGTGSGAGGGGGAATGGGMMIFCKDVKTGVSTPAAVIQSKGGTGGAGGAAVAGNRGGGGAGGGGGGGLVYIVSDTRTGSTVTNAIDVSGGNGGAGGVGFGTGTNGGGAAGGSGGAVVIFTLGTSLTPAYSVQDTATGGAPSGTTGGTGATKQVNM